MTIKVVTLFAQETLAEFLMFNSISKNNKFHWVNIIPIAMLFCSIWALKTNETFIAVISILAGILVPYCYLISIKKIIRSEISRCQPLFGKQMYTLYIDEFGITAENPSTASDSRSFSWQEIDSVWNVGKFYYIYNTRKTAFIVNKRDLRNNEALFEKIISQNLMQLKIRTCTSPLHKKLIKTKL